MSGENRSQLGYAASVASFGPKRHIRPPITDIEIRIAQPAVGLHMSIQDRVMNCNSVSIERWTQRQRETGIPQFFHSASILKLQLCGYTLFNDKEVTVTASIDRKRC